MKFFIWSITIFLIGLIVWLVCNATDNNHYGNYASCLGTLFTILAFGITLHQIIIVKEQNKMIRIETEKAARKASEKIKTVLTASEISDTINLLQIIQQNLLENKIDLALYQMKEINKVLLEILKEESYKSILRNNYEANMSAYSSDILFLQNLISQQIVNDSNLLPVIKDICHIEENIILIRNHLKKRAYE